MLLYAVPSVSSHLYVFTLINNCHPFYVDTWLRATNMRDLRELDLFLPAFSHQPMELPRTLYFSTSLVVLKLGFAIHLNPPSAFVLPCLRILLLNRFTFTNRDSLSTILNACPVLLDLTLHVYEEYLKILNEFNVIVPVATLKRLHLRWNVQPSSKYRFQINTPALEYFHFRGYLSRNDVLETLPNVVEYVVQIEGCDRINDYAKRAWDFVGKLCNVISMELSTVTAQILCHGSNHENSPTFRNLSSLKFCGDIWHAVRLLLCRAPELQTLVFERSFLLGFNLDNPNPCLEEPLDVPECMSSHLSTCFYKGFKGVENEMELVRQILKAARVLKTMKITSHSGLDPRNKPSVRKKLRKFQRSSRNCQISFDEGHFT